MRNTDMVKKLKDTTAPAPEAPDTPSTDTTFEQATADIIATWDAMHADIAQAKTFLRSGTEKMLLLGDLLIAVEPLYKKEKLTFDVYIKNYIEKIAVPTAHMAKRMARRLKRFPEMRAQILDLPVIEADRKLTRAYRLLDEKYNQKIRSEKRNYNSVNERFRTSISDLSDCLRDTKHFYGSDDWRALLNSCPNGLREMIRYLTTDFDSTNIPDLPKSELLTIDDVDSAEFSWQRDEVDGAAQDDQAAATKEEAETEADDDCASRVGVMLEAAE